MRPNEVVGTFTECWHDISKISLMVKTVELQKYPLCTVVVQFCVTIKQDNIRFQTSQKTLAT